MISNQKGAKLTKTKSFSKFISLIKQNRSFLITGHINPEGDSLGSSLALALGLKKMGKKDVCVLSKDPVPEILKFLPSSKIVRQKPPGKEFDVVFMVDCNDIERTGYEGFRAKKTAIIDHHVLPANAEKSEFYKSVSASYIDTGAAAAGVLIYKLLTALKIPVDKNMATNLYTAILVDTGGFRYSNASAESLRIASHLVAAGARPWDISKEVYESMPFRSMKLLGLSLATLERKEGIAWITTTNGMFKKTGATAEDSEDFVDFPRKVKDIEVAVFFRQNGAKSYKLSFRSKGRVNVQKIAKSFGGGGHFAAAGCKINGSLKEVQNKVFSAVRKAIKET
ncbi:MAG TPA: bifunctional oligoribonuclease/PAP phosphatase NrnA [Nitrospirae bacterium]|nr:bifunctional oligoribonuclease and PAP phosphatase NrnA [bacterium BMS3Abin06]HDH12400.1 bifunctional oligoribonuclease/PAP phosphatase NrnA [Nitrospirota bacterium]